jgi:putative membrane-bound dehydrogenase-like protein
METAAAETPMASELMAPANRRKSNRCGSSPYQRSLQRGRKWQPRIMLVARSKEVDNWLDRVWGESEDVGNVPTWTGATRHSIYHLLTMKNGTWLTVLGLLGAAAGADIVNGPLPAEKAAKNMVLPDGFHASVFAAEPNVVQPVSFCVDARGRIIVAEALNYGAWQPTGKDRVVILEDKGDGKGVQRKVFYEGLNYITGIEAGFGGVYVMSPPSLYFIADKDGDDVPDRAPEVLFDGFGYKESRHNLANGFTWGPDGWLYAGHGRTSPSNVGRPGSPDKDRIHSDGGVVRIHPTRLVFENFTDGNTNPWGVDFDDFGQCFVSNCVDPHLFHMIQGGHYEPWRGRPSSMYAYERLPTVADHWHFPTGRKGEMRGETPTTLAMGGGHAHCGTLVYLGGLFPAQYRNTVFMCNIHGRRINNDILKPKGSGYTASHGKDFMISADPWFMGVTLRTGPDGSVFVSDWSDTGECHTYKPNRESGRIYKISYGKPAIMAVDLAKLGDLELANLQTHPNDWHVRHARRILQERSGDPKWDAGPAHAALRKILDSLREDAPKRLRALWALHVTGGLDEKRLLGLLRDPSPHVRAWSIHLLCETNPPAAALSQFAEMAKSDAAPVVRLYLASALQRIPGPQRWPIAENLLRRGEDAGDANIPLMTWYGVEPIVPVDPAAAIARLKSVEIPLGRRFIARRLADEAVTRPKNADLGPLLQVVAERDDVAQLDLLRGVREGIRGAKSLPMPKGWPEVYARLARGNDTVREHAVALALAFGDPRAAADLRKTVDSLAASVGERTAALQSLIDKRDADLAPVLHRLLADPNLRSTALRGLAANPHPDTPATVLALYAKLSAADKQEAIAALSSRKEYARALLAAVESKTVPAADVTAFTARQLHALGDDPISAQLRKLWGDVRDTSPKKQEQIDSYKKLLTPDVLARGDRPNGRAVFLKNCQQCHRLYGDGGKIGPDLTGSNRSNLDYLLSNMIEPSAEVAKDYRLSIVTTNDGRVLTGMIIERAGNRITLQTATQPIVLAKDEIEETRESTLSLMPEGQVDQLTREQVRDLVAYLAGNSQVPLPPGAREKK